MFKTTCRNCEGKGIMLLSAGIGLAKCAHCAGHGYRQLDFITPCLSFLIAMFASVGNLAINLVMLEVSFPNPVYYLRRFENWLMCPISLHELFIPKLRIYAL